MKTTMAEKARADAQRLVDERATFIRGPYGGRWVVFYHGTKRGRSKADLVGIVAAEMLNANRF